MLTSFCQNLDVQYTVGLATGVPVYFISVGESANDGVYGFLDTANYILSNLSDAYVVTTSYGSDESDISTDVFRCVACCKHYAIVELMGRTPTANCVIHMRPSALLAFPYSLHLAMAVSQAPETPRALTLCLRSHPVAPSKVYLGFTVASLTLC